MAFKSKVQPRNSRIRLCDYLGHINNTIIVNMKINIVPSISIRGPMIARETSSAIRPTCIEIV